MNRLATAALALACLFGPAWAEEKTDLEKHATCHYCGMDREKFGHSRMILEYEGGKTVGTCSLHCAALDLALAVDGAPSRVRVADFRTKQLVDADAAIWVIGGAKTGVMTKRAKWAFADRASADAFVKENGGKLATFDEALQAAYEDMYGDVKMIREKRRAMKAKAAAEAHR
jgi:nitrous oxide reductase accessory protein NosL